MTYYVNEDIRNTERVFPEQGRAQYHRYDMNENPEGLPRDFVDAVLREITPEFLATYPEPDRFLKKYAAFLGVKFENVLAVNGSDMGIRYLLETFGERGGEVVTVSPSFEMYRINCSLLGLKHVPVEYEDDLTIRMDKILSAMTENTRILVLLNPNNPIGNVYTEEELRAAVERAEEVGAVVIVDEAYHYFYPHTFLKIALQYENVVILRTFSKLFSLAACRLGVLIGNPRLIGFVKKARLSFDVNSVALLFGERILEQTELIQQLIDREADGRSYLLQRLNQHGYVCWDGTGNYVFVKSKHPPFTVTQRLKEQEKILVHPYQNHLLKDYIRVSTGSRSAMEYFADAFLRADSDECGEGEPIL